MGLSWQPIKNQLARHFQLLELNAWHINFQLFLYYSITIFNTEISEFLFIYIPSFDMYISLNFFFH